MIDEKDQSSSTQLKATVGVYDPRGSIGNQVRMMIDPDQLCIFDEALIHQLTEESPYSHVLVKSVFLAQCKHYIIDVDGIDSLSILAGAFKAIESDNSKRLVVIMPSDLASMLFIGGSFERSRTEQLVALGRLIIRNRFQPDDILFDLGLTGPCL